MAKPKKIGQCAKRLIVVQENELCDWFEVKRKGRYKVCCRNCKHFNVKEVDVKSDITHDQELPE